MPFTISHTAAVLPFARYLSRWRVVSAAVIGSMVPDFSLLLPWRLARFETHSIIGLGTFCLPVGMATYWLFQWLIKPAVLELLPDGAYLRSRPNAMPADFFNVRQWLVASAGVLAGAVTHLAWDDFTHEGARGVRMFPMLDDSVGAIGGHHLMAFKVMQLASSLVGILLVLWLLVRALRIRAQQPVPGRLLDPAQRHGWLSAYAAVTLAGSAASFLAMQLTDPHRLSIGSAANEAAVSALRGLAIALIGVSVVLRQRLPHPAQPAA